MADAVWRTLEPGDLEYLAEHLREADRAEIVASNGPDVLNTLRRSVAVSVDVVVWELGGEFAALLGVAPISLLLGKGCPWLLGTPVIARHPRPYQRAARCYVDHLRRTFTHLTNHVDARNTTSIRWLKRLGFTVAEVPEPFGVEGLPFHHFEMRV